MVSRWKDRRDRTGSLKSLACDSQAFLIPAARVRAGKFLIKKVAFSCSSVVPCKKYSLYMGLIYLIYSYSFFIWGYFEGTTVGTTRELLGNCWYLAGNYFEGVKFPM